MKTGIGECGRENKGRKDRKRRRKEHLEAKEKRYSKERGEGMR